MASQPPASGPSPQHLMTLGMFVFGMDTLAYQSLTRSLEWRHPSLERHGARPAYQFAGPGEETISLSGLLIPEIAGSYSALGTIEAMGTTGDDYPLMDGNGNVLGHFVIKSVNEEHRAIWAGGTPRQKAVTIELIRVDS